MLLTSHARLVTFPIDTGRKLNVHKTFRRRPGRLLKVLCTFSLRPVSTGFEIKRLLSTFYCTDYPIFFLSCGLPFTHNFTKSSTRKYATWLKITPTPAFYKYPTWSQKFISNLSVNITVFVFFIIYKIKT